MKMTRSESTNLRAFEELRNFRIKQWSESIYIHLMDGFMRLKPTNEEFWRVFALLLAQFGRLIINYTLWH